MGFYVGQKVVCVDDSHPIDFCFWDVEINIRNGHIYQVRGFDKPRGGVIGIYLEGIYQRARRGGPDHGKELAWHPKRFRPLLGDEQEQLTAIEEEVKEEELIPV
jgi:hypothetical protein